MKKLIKSSPLKLQATVSCNKSTIEICDNSLQIRWGMEIRLGDERPWDSEVYIEYVSYSGIPGNITATIRLSENIDSYLSVGSAITFHGDRTLNFHPDRKITGLNVIDGMIFWTDNHSEPKKVNIERGKIGSLSSIYGAGYDGSLISPDPLTWGPIGVMGGTGTDCRNINAIMPDGSVSLACYSDFDQHTKLIVNKTHVMECEKSTTDCDIPGCTNPSAINYYPQATLDDGSCIIPIPPVEGCDDGTFGALNVNACNSGMTFWSAAVTGNPYDYNTNNSSLCIIPFDNCEMCELDANGDKTGVVVPNPICGGCNDTSIAADSNIAATNYVNQPEDCGGATGGNNISCCEYCTDPLALNYYNGINDCLGNPGGSDVSCCTYPPPGCTDSTMCNYDPAAVIDDGSCMAPGCISNSAFNYDANAPCGSGMWSNTNPNGCYPVVLGCTNPVALNYITPTTNLLTDVNTDDGSCILSVFGCTDVNAINYNSGANIDDGSCYHHPGCTCDGGAGNGAAPANDCYNDGVAATNYDALADYDDGSCIEFVPSIGCGGYQTPSATVLSVPSVYSACPSGPECDCDPLYNTQCAPDGELNGDWSAVDIHNYIQSNPALWHVDLTNYGIDCAYNTPPNGLRWFNFYGSTEWYTGTWCQPVFSGNAADSTVPNWGFPYNPSNPHYKMKQFPKITATNLNDPPTPLFRATGGGYPYCGSAANDPTLIGTYPTATWKAGGNCPYPSGSSLGNSSYTFLVWSEYVDFINTELITPAGGNTITYANATWENLKDELCNLGWLHGCSGQPSNMTGGSGGIVFGITGSWGCICQDVNGVNCCSGNVELTPGVWGPDPCTSTWS